jgi:hypothetical protein
MKVPNIHMGTPTETVPVSMITYVVMQTVEKSLRLFYTLGKHPLTEIRLLATHERKQ